MNYILRRLGFYLLAGWVSLTLAFIIPRLMPGDPAATMFARLQGKLSPEAMVALRKAFGFNDAPLWQQYLSYLSHLLEGDMGMSVTNFPTPVTDVIGTALIWTIFLAGTAVVFSFVIGTALGIVTAWRRGGRLDTIAPPLFVFLGAFPYFWLAMLALYGLGLALGWFPVRHAYAMGIQPGMTWEFVSSVVGHAVLPAGTIVLATLATWLLPMRNTMIGVLGEDYVAMAQAKGLHPRRVMLRYAARNALLPSITSFGMALGFVLSGSLLTEIVFSYPGQGYLLVNAVTGQDYPLIQGLFLTITFAVLAANWFVDIVYVLLDPRTR